MDWGFHPRSIPRARKKAFLVQSLAAPRHGNRPHLVHPACFWLTIGATCHRATIHRMIDRKLIDELGQKVARTLRDTPAADVERNLRVLLSGFFDRLSLVPREDFDVQRKLLERAQAKLAALETRVAELEARESAHR